MSVASDVLLCLVIFAFFALPLFDSRARRRVCGRCAGSCVERFTDVHGDFHFERCEVCGGTGWVKGRE